MSKTKSNLPIFVIFSKKSLRFLENTFIDNFNGEPNVDFIFRVNFKNNKDTNLTFLLTTKEFGDKLQENMETLSNFDITINKFELNSKYNPKEDQKYELFLRFPRNIPDVDNLYYKQVVEKRVEDMTKILGIDFKSVFVQTNNVSRITEEYRDFCKIKFKDHLPKEIISIMKIMLHDSLWFENNSSVRMLCVWSRTNLKSSKAH